MEGKLFQKYLKMAYEDLEGIEKLGIGNKHLIMKKARELTLHYLNNPQGPEENILKNVKEFKKYLGEKNWIEKILISDAVCDAKIEYERKFSWYKIE